MIGVRRDTELVVLRFDGRIESVSRPPRGSGEVGLEILGRQPERQSIQRQHGITERGESFLVTMMVEVDPINFGLIVFQPVLNSATAAGVPKDGANNPLTNPDTGDNFALKAVNDVSDDGTGLDDNGDPDESNSGAEGDGTGLNIYDDLFFVNLLQTLLHYTGTR